MRSNKSKAKNHVFDSRDLSFSVVALRLSFKLPMRKFSSSFCTVDDGTCSQCSNSQGLWNLPLEKSFDNLFIFHERMETWETRNAHRLSSLSLPVPKRLIFASTF